jgi:hypothetical protein
MNTRTKNPPMKVVMELISKLGDMAGECAVMRNDNLDDAEANGLAMVAKLKEHMLRVLGNRQLALSWDDLRLMTAGSLRTLAEYLEGE